MSTLYCPADNIDRIVFIYLRLFLLGTQHGNTRLLGNGWTQIRQNFAWLEFSWNAQCQIYIKFSQQKLRMLAKIFVKIRKHMLSPQLYRRERGNRVGISGGIHWLTTWPINHHWGMPQMQLSVLHFIIRTKNTVILNPSTIAIQWMYLTCK